MTRAVAAIALALCAGGCDYLFQIDHVTLAGDARQPSDVDRGDGSSQGICTATRIYDAFGSSTPCTWGTKFGGTYVTSGNGRLTIAPPSDAYSGGCEAPEGAFADGGIVAEITQVIGGSAYAYTGIQAYGTIDTSIHVNAGSLKFAAPSSVPVWAEDEYDPVAMRWVRIRPDRANTAIEAEYSSDAKTWMRLGSVATPVPVTVKATLIGGVAQGAPVISGVAEFSHFIVCL